MQRCENCPTNCQSRCIGENSNLHCRKVNPDDSLYNPAHAEFIRKVSCGEKFVFNVEVDITPQEKPKESEFPPLVDQAKNFVGSMFNYAKSGFKNVSDEEYNRRLDICKGCEFYENLSGRCLKCGCNMAIKSRMESSKCPMNFWQTEKKPLDLNTSVLVHPLTSCGGCNQK